MNAKLSFWLEHLNHYSGIYITNIIFSFFSLYHKVKLEAWSLATLFSNWPPIVVKGIPLLNCDVCGIKVNFVRATWKIYISIVVSITYLLASFTAITSPLSTLGYNINCTPVIAIFQYDLQQLAQSFGVVQKVVMLWAKNQVLFKTIPNNVVALWRHIPWKTN